LTAGRKAPPPFPISAESKPELRLTTTLSGMPSPFRAAGLAHDVKARCGQSMLANRIAR